MLTRRSVGACGHWQLVLVGCLPVSVSHTRSVPHTRLLWYNCRSPNFGHFARVVLMGFGLPFACLRSVFCRSLLCCLVCWLWLLVGGRAASVSQARLRWYNCQYPDFERFARVSVPFACLRSVFCRSLLCYRVCWLVCGLSLLVSFVLLVCVCGAACATRAHSPSARLSRACHLCRAARQPNGRTYYTPPNRMSNGLHSYSLYAPQKRCQVLLGGTFYLTNGACQAKLALLWRIEVASGPTAAYATHSATECQTAPGWG